MAVYTVSLRDSSNLGQVNVGDGTLLAKLSVAAGRGPKGDGWTGVTYDNNTGRFTFTSNDGLDYVSEDITTDLDTAVASAQTAQANAETAETNAATSETNAATSEINAETAEANAAASATNAATSEINAGISATDAATSEINAATSETNAATSATNAATSETNAATSATNAATSETNASTSATAAQTAEVAAQAAQTAAEAAEAATEALFDQFGDQYLGPKASDPTVDNDGDPLTEGDVYFNTTDDVLKFYSGSTWVAPESIATTAATAAQTAQAAAETAETNAETAEVNAAASETAAATSETNAATSETNAAASETNAATSETNAAASATAAETAETNAETAETNAQAAQAAAEVAETNAATSETNASISETNAATSATNAATSETNAATSATNAAASASAASTSATNASSYNAEASTSASNAATSETNAATSETNAATSATNANSAEINAATSEANAAISKISAATSEANAATSETNASASETAAAASETAAAASETAAELAKVAAEAALDDFEDLYLGAKSSDPTVDNDGDPLVEGALYFNTTDDIMKVYEGSQWLAAFASLSGALLSNNNLSDVASASTSRENLGLGASDDPTFASVSVGTVDLEVLSAHAPYKEGRVWYDDVHKTINYYSEDQNIVHEVGLEEHQRVFNNSGSTILKGKPLYFSGNYTAGTMDVPTVGLADATDVNAYNAQGLAASDIPNNSYGYCIIAGQLDGLDTSGLSDGTNFFVGLTAGAVQNDSPLYPNFPMCLGWVVKADATDGILLVNQQNHSVNSFRVRTSAHIGTDLQVDGNLTVLGSTTSVSTSDVTAGAPFYRANEGDAIGEAGTTFSGTGLDDAFFAGHFTGTTPTTYYVKIDGVGTGTGGVDTFAWSTDNFVTSAATGVDITGEPQLIHSTDNISVTFSSTTGHTLDDQWNGTASPINVDSGFFTNYNTGTSGVGYTHTGFYYDASEGKWILLDEYDPVPAGAIDLSDSSVSYATLKASVFEGNVTGDVTGNASTASSLETARTIGGVSFNGTANIDLAGVNTTGNQDTTGNAATATALETARTIQLSGDVTGSASFDGSANVTITATVQDDSHSHVISNVDGLQTALDGKTTTSRTITAGSGLTGGGDLTANRTISHADTSTQASVNNSGGTVIQDITLDEFGHLTGLASVNLDGRYYTESEADSRFISSTADDTASGVVTFTDRIQAHEIRTNTGQELILNAGESANYATGQTGEFVYVNSEGGLQVNSTPDNWASGWAGRYTTTIGDSNGKSIFPNGVKIESATGYADFGSTNSTWFHMTTDRPNFYMNKGLMAAGNVGVYNSSTYMTSAAMYINGIELRESTDRADLLQITGQTSTWAGIQIRNSSNEGRWSFMTDGATGGFYDDENGDWAIQMAENSEVRLYYNASEKLNTHNTGVTVTGSLTATGNVTAYSDERLKSDIRTISNALDKVKALRGVTYIKDEAPSIGVIAQEVEKVIPEVVAEGEEYKSVAYGNMVGLLIEAIKEQQEQIDELKRKLEG